MSTIIVDTLTGKSTATTITIGSTPVVSASANSMTIRGEGSNQTSIQQGLGKVWVNFNMANSTSIYDSFNIASLTDVQTGSSIQNFTTNMSNDDFAQVEGTGDNGEQFNNSRALGVASVNTAKTTSKTILDTAGQTANTHYDFKENCIVVHGDLA